MEPRFAACALAPKAFAIRLETEWLQGCNLLSTERVHHMTPDSRQAPLASGVRSLLMGAGALGAIVAVSVATLTVFHSGPSRPGAHPPTGAASRAGLGLRAEVRGGSLQVSWNHDAAPVRNATSGSLTFQDGETRKTLQLSQTTARAGTVFYAARGTQVQVALTIFAPDHVVSESISAAVPAAAAKSDLPPAGEAGTEVLAPSGDREVSVASPQAGRPTQGSQTGASAPLLGLREPDRESQPVSPEHGVAAGRSAPPTDLHEEPAAAGDLVPEVAAPGSVPKLSPGTVAVRVYVDEKGKVVEAVLVPQKDVNPAFAEAALETARDWRFDSSPSGNQRTTRVLEFRQSANR
jgi:TonB family protein